MANSGKQPFSTARFANVAFSDGSLPYGFLQRINKKQPLSAPHDIKRYFISHQEAGELCVLACVLGENRDVFFPKFESGKDETVFSEIAVDLLQSMGYEPVVCGSEEEAKARSSELIPKKQWPCYFFQSDTTGEKGFEEFYSHEEQTDLDRYSDIGIIQREFFQDHNLLDTFIEFCRHARADNRLSKADYVQAMLKVVPMMQHVETGKNLDEKM